MGATTFFSYRPPPFPTERGAGGIGRQMTQQSVTLLEANYVSMITLSVLYMPYSTPYLLISCLHTCLPIPRPAGGPFPRGRGFAICGYPFQKLRGISILLCAAPSPPYPENLQNPQNPFTPAKQNQQEKYI